jgi:alkylation response protein AidB-like acyl-CoA dehydrogenase
VAVPDATGGWLLSGSKAYVVDAGVADVVLVSANTPHGVGLFAIDPDATGCAVVARPPLDLTRRLSRIELAATPGQLLSGDRDVAAALTSARDHSFVALTAEQVGVATGALQMAVNYAGQREQFGHPIGQFQAIKHMCAEMLVDVESAAALASSLARSADNGDDLALPAAMAKALGSDVAFAVAARTIQVHGGIGFTWEHDAHLYYRRAKSSELMFGDGAWQRRRVAGLLNL